MCDAMKKLTAEMSLVRRLRRRFIHVEEIVYKRS